MTVFQRLVTSVFFVAMATGLPAAGEDPFTATPSLTRANDGDLRLSVAFGIRKNHYLYADKLDVHADKGIELKPMNIPPPKLEHDTFEEKEVGKYHDDVTFLYSIKGTTPLPVRITIGYQGCSDKECLFPVSRDYSLSLPAQTTTTPTPTVTNPAEPAPAALTPTQSPLADTRFAAFRMTGRASGYLTPEEFTRFLDNVEAGNGMEKDKLQAVLEQQGIGMVVILILLGGLLLNLTPCVLPMIPINIAIIGAGAQAGSRTRGFLLGGIYGLGIALVYGLLGTAVVLTGSKFGTLNSSPWFNLAIAALFIVMSLAMFGLFNLDFSRFQGPLSGDKPRHGRFTSAFMLGGVAALLAGACVAPVLISVLLLAAQLYAAGNPAGLLLPFLLGVGMALPWPFAGAGLSFLPKPGRWMEWVKYAFGVIILATALWYGWLGISLLRERSDAIRDTLNDIQKDNAHRGWQHSLEMGLASAREQNKPVFVDCWASWCKNCLKMEKTTFQDPNVNRKLDAYIKIKFRAEDMNDPAVKPVLDHFGALGLPTYVVLHPLTPSSR